MSYFKSIQLDGYWADWAFMADAFWRQRVAAPYTLFDAKTLRKE